MADGNRATGKTTRAVDYFVQRLFTAEPEEWIHIYDDEEENKDMCDRAIIRKISQRLAHEHARTITTSHRDGGWHAKLRPRS